jgi:DNA-binding MarR family transcriptional regulator
MGLLMHPPGRDGRPSVIGVGFLLSQLGAHSASSFAARIAPLGLTPPQVGLLRVIGEQPGRSQQSIADEFGLPPSRLVGFIDTLEASGMVERRRDTNDRRVHLLHLSPAGEQVLEELAAIGQTAETDLLSSLTVKERKVLSELLSRVADQQGLSRGVHPGYKRLRPDAIDCPPDAGP